MTSETRTTLTFLGAGLVAAAMVLGADMSWADVVKALFYANCSRSLTNFAT